MAQDWLDEPLSLLGKKIWIAGHQGMVGSALCRRLADEPCEVLTAPRTLDLRNQEKTLEWMEAHRPDMVIVAAAKVGGILANEMEPAAFLYDNLMISANVIEAARLMSVKKLLYLGSSCIYPRLADQPVKEQALLSGALEPTNAPYALAKICGVKLCESYAGQYGSPFVSAMPCNLYGPGDRYDLKTSHVVPALIMKAHQAKTSGAKVLELWGSGLPLREFMHVDDAADGLVFLLQNYQGEGPINLGYGEDVSIAELGYMIRDIVGFVGELSFDADMPDGTPKKLMDNSRMRAAGWKPSIPLEEGLRDAYDWYLEHVEEQRDAA